MSYSSRPILTSFARFFSENQLNIFGAVADLCKELSKDSEVAWKPAANEDGESMEIPTELPIADPHTNAELQGNLPQDYEHLNIRNCPNCAAGAGLLKIVEKKRQLFITIHEEEGPDEMKNPSRGVHFTSK